MRQIQKCPHCHKDAVFSQSICPNCGLESRYEEREEPDYKQDLKGKVPVYAELMENEMTESQKHGGILLGMILGLLGLPWVALLVTSLVLLGEKTSAGMPIARSLLMCCVLAFAAWKLWHGCCWLKWVHLAFAGLAGIGMAIYGSSLIWEMMHGQEVNPCMLLMGVVYGMVYIWCGYQLWHSKDIPEFLRYQKILNDEAE